MQLPIHGRGASYNPPNRFEPLSYEPDPEWVDPDEPDPWKTTQYFRDAARTVLTRNNSPDVPFDVGLNPYRGCSHGCAYCFARPNHEYLGLSAGLDFESKIFVKLDAPQLLRAELSSRRWKPEPIIMSGVTDPYQPAERRFRITRGCLEVLTEFRNPIAIITKNHLVTRDVDLLAELASHGAAVVNVSITSLEVKLQRVMEPRTSIPARRLAAVETLSRPRERDDRAGRARTHGPRAPRHPPRRRRRRGPLRGIHPPAASRRRRGHLPAVARGSLPGPEGAGAEPHPRDPRGEVE